jgi:hypothetical protein
MEKNEKELFCKLCNYKTNKNTQWLKHIETEKHKRNGEKKPTKCDECEYVTNTHWNVKAHKLQVHATPEERAKQKYYCNLCDLVFFCSAYKTKHDTGRNHLVKVRVQESLNQTDKIYNEKSQAS